MEITFKIVFGLAVILFCLLVVGIFLLIVKIIFLFTPEIVIMGIKMLPSSASSF